MQVNALDANKLESQFSEHWNVGFTRNLYFVFCILLLKPSNEASLKKNDVGEVNYEQG